ncbi:3'-5' exonuclease [Tepidibacter formicigenes]|uniref:Exonuclease n=1 Tax=Tepidibacter formicigenes DSM 15518 TaxID=1123349 RepID=A0A1M6PYV7_9FIRM|nr:3'-5' exonuclease [Tepidibacter formicigenes]SHK13129.1 Exonuclease [Tepidibacter formicigenes DSM 15518]
MNYIVFDLELNSKPFKSKIPNEIVEIGAVKINENLEIIDRFQSFIKPKYFPKLFRTIKKKTKISQVDINNAQSFDTVLNFFKNWIGKEYILFSWGYDDYYHFKTNCTLHELDINWLYKFVNIQKQFAHIYKFEKGQYPSLKNALNKLDIPLEEDDFHRADIDAEYTAKIFIKVFNKLTFSNVLKN